MKLKESCNMEMEAVQKIFDIDIFRAKGGHKKRVLSDIQMSASFYRLSHLAYFIFEIEKTKEIWNGKMDMVQKNPVLM